MSVWPKSQLATASLLGSDGALVSVSIDVVARRLEALLEALSQVSFPVNPEIFHDALVAYRYADGHEETTRATVVEFPAYAGQLEEVRRALEAYGFDRKCMQVTSMLEEIQSEDPAASGVTRRRLKHSAAAVQ